MRPVVVIGKNFTNKSLIIRELKKISENPRVVNVKNIVNSYLLNLNGESETRPYTEEEELAALETYFKDHPVDNRDLFVEGISLSVMSKFSFLDNALIIFTSSGYDLPEDHPKIYIGVHSAHQSIIDFGSSRFCR